ncbi:SAG1386/EF1546 family surface-associated protein [Limosilactobacillus secaliphilus]|uniref:LysM domain-containing protein n=1 Tax=Limosilactobacillus secaliphilus TaxID=396268 RepID=A0A0R2IA92_9LACO|nr:SAG1386/EF1546 family surface-associated protein [Limosilactobacillus secaliphilus]KRN58858.1 hypothetical protein IV45_GL000485 [Limosilactobacillus secaliphilus]
MSEKREDQHPENQKLWDKTFEDNEGRDSQGNLSRMQRRRQTSHDSRITTILVLLIIILAIMPIVYWAQHQQSFNHPAREEKVAATSKSHKKASSHKKRSHKKSSKHDRSSQELDNQTASASSSSYQSNQTGQSNSQSNSNNRSYVTVNQGQGMYRVAANNGLTVDQLARMNNLKPGSQIHPGQQLRVK